MGYYTFHVLEIQSRFMLAVDVLITFKCLIYIYDSYYRPFSGKCESCHTPNVGYLWVVGRLYQCTSGTKTTVLDTMLNFT